MIDPAAPMTPAELRTLREALGLSHDDVAQLVKVQSRSVKFWEQGNQAVPADVAELLRDMDRNYTATAAQVTKTWAMAIQVSSQPLQPIVLLRYASAEDVRHYRPDMGALPLTTHATLLNRIRLGLEARGVVVRVVYMVPDEYEPWRRAQQRDDNEDSRNAWAALQVAAQSLPRPRGQPAA